MPAIQSPVLPVMPLRVWKFMAVSKDMRVKKWIPVGFSRPRDLQTKDCCEESKRRQESYASKREDLEEEDQGEDERNVIL